MQANKEPYLVIRHFVNIGEEKEDEVGPGLPMGFR